LNVDRSDGPNFGPSEFSTPSVPAKFKPPKMLLPSAPKKFRGRDHSALLTRLYGEGVTESAIVDCHKSELMQLSDGTPPEIIAAVAIRTANGRNAKPIAERVSFSGAGCEATWD
jgi:hypothetical protein